ncbi:DUF7426 family protein [Rhodococcus qingshengii]|uniref:DUF7426 family protein n=1 Tax=Rhodococcus qingshengii TaxID=334542 RepID=UPI00071E5DA3|nr:hypothetical protein [Rhodococcus qingshengii]KSU81598.1 hypothetical protein AS032_06145 [Rhodococcus qingshengii]SCC00850.1 hypothetical protein GA0061093_102411 [Rhodococcus qingshengii]
MAYKDLDTFFDPDLHLPIRGKTYTVPAPGGPEAERLRKQVIAEGLPQVMQVFEALKILGAEIDPETETWSGGVYDEMVADDLPWPMIFHAGRTAIINFGFSADMAESHWALAQLGKMVDLKDATEMVGKFMAHVKTKQ